MAAPMEQKIRVLELYSGIGGMHYALEASGIQFEVVAAMDINTNANMVYKHNFPHTFVNSSAIESLTVKKFDAMKIDAILMSPPCQPFTRVGKQRDTDDVRTKSFLHILDLLKKSEKCPSYILLENVKGFESSESRQRLIETLSECNYCFQEFLLTPLQFGIPNSRLRYFLTAKKRPLKFSFTQTEEIMDCLTGFPPEWFSYKKKAESETQSIQRIGKSHICICRRTSIANESMNKVYTSKICDSSQIDKSKRVHDCDNCDVDFKRKRLELEETGGDFEAQSDCGKDSNIDAVDQTNALYRSTEMCTEGLRCLQNFGENMRQSTTDEQRRFGPCLKLCNFLDNGFQDKGSLEAYILPDKDLKRFMVMDMVYPCSQKTCCFTKRYGHYIDGGGSLVLMTTDVKNIQKASALKETISLKDAKTIQWEQEQIEIIRRLHLRYFTPREIANLLCFPSKFHFPEGLTNRQLYMLLGNSLNVHIVSVLIRIMTKDT